MRHVMIAALLAASMPTLVAAQTVQADTPGQSAAGVAYVQPKDWTKTVRGPVTLLTPPEADTNIVIVDVGAAADAKAAAEKAWALFDPNWKRAIRTVTASAPKEGWDERALILYDFSPNEKKWIGAWPLRQGSNWTVLLADGAEATFDKRGAALNLLVTSLRPAGYAPESFAGKAAHRLTPARVAAMREFVGAAMKELDVPGAALAFIDQGKVVWQGGLGVRELGKPDPVTADTRFMIASNTKGMATLLLSTLVDEGKLKWDQPVREVFPAFRLGNDATTNATLIRHLVCACTGLPRKDLEWAIAGNKDLPASDTFRQLAATQPTSRFGDIFQYSNLMASAAGYVGGAVAYPGTELGAAFDKAMQVRLFDPLGMKNTTFDYAKAMAGNWASPHGLDFDRRMIVQPMAFNFTIYPYRPAGAAWSTAADMAKYVQLELSKGVLPNGKRLVSEAALTERRKPGVSEGEKVWYGMGLSTSRQYGVEVVYHGGSMLGYKSNWYAIPEAGIGAVILTNAEEGGAMLRPFMRRLLEITYDGKPEAMRDVVASAARIKAEIADARNRTTIPGDPAVLAGLASNYRNADLGLITVTRQDGQTIVKAGVNETPVGTRKNADGTTSLIGLEGAVVGFEMVLGGAAPARTITIRDSQHEYIYTEVR